MGESNTIYPSSSSTIELLRKNYDTLVQEAILFFKNQKFERQALTLTVHSLDEFILDGFIHIDGIPQIIEKIENGKDIVFRNPLIGRSKVVDISFTPYRSNFPLGQLKGRIEYNGAIPISDTIGNFFTLPKSEERVSMMKNMLVSFELHFDFIAEVMKDSAHYLVDHVINGSGEFNLGVTLIPKGFESKGDELIGKYNVKLDEKNTQFRFHDFVQPDGSLVGRGSLDLKSTTQGNLSFS